jgi:hypothetical protein
VGHQRNKESNKKILKSNDKENTTYQNLKGHCKGSVERKVHSHKSLYLRKSEISAKIWWLTPIILATQEAEIRRISV